MLECGHWICVGCFAKLRENHKLHASSCIKLLHPDNEDYDCIMVECFKCLAFFKISKLGIGIGKFTLSCGCTPKTSADLLELIRRWRYSEVTYSFAFTISE